MEIMNKALLAAALTFILWQSDTAAKGPSDLDGTHYVSVIYIEPETNYLKVIKNDPTNELLALSHTTIWLRCKEEWHPVRVVPASSPEGNGEQEVALEVPNRPCSIGISSTNKGGYQSEIYEIKE